jgi:hypothetical protein
MLDGVQLGGKFGGVHGDRAGDLQIKVCEVGPGRAGVVPGCVAVGFLFLGKVVGFRFLLAKSMIRRMNRLTNVEALCVNTPGWGVAARGD